MQGLRKWVLLGMGGRPCVTQRGNLGECMWEEKAAGEGSEDESKGIRS